MSAKVHHFGPFVFNSERLSLQCDGSPVVLGQHALSLLGALLEAQGEIVDRADLIEAAWRGAVVEEANLTVQIGALRKVLGRAPDGQDWITTVPRRGYKLRIADLPSAGLSSNRSRRRWLAVLPFENMNGDPQQEHLADGIVEDITTALSRLKSIAVVARSSSFSYKGRSVDVRRLGAELGADYVLEGSLRRAGVQMRVTAQLIDATDGSHLWARSFDTESTNELGVQDEIATRLAFSLDQQIQRAEIQKAGTKWPATLSAYELNMQATSLAWSDIRRNNAEAYALFLRAIEIDPHYAQALSRASQVLSLRRAWGWGTMSEADQATCLDLCWRAMAEAPDDGAVLAVCANSLIAIGRQYDLGLEVIANALAANPSHAGIRIQAGFAHLRCGCLELSIEHFRYAIAMTNPGDLVLNGAHYGISEFHMATHNFAEALRKAEQTVVLNKKHDCPYWVLISANALLGRIDEAQRWLAVFRELSPDVTVASLRLGHVFKFPERFDPILRGLQLAGLPES
jgi:TolB-like protein